MTAVAEQGATFLLDVPKVLHFQSFQVKMTARCLFGAPDPAQNEALVSKVHETKRWGFERKWNFSIQNESQLAPSPPAESGYQWEESFQSDFMAKCDSQGWSRMSTPSRVTLLSAPIILDELPQIELEELEDDSLRNRSVMEKKSIPLPEPHSERSNSSIHSSPLSRVPSRSPFMPSSSNSRSRRSSPLRDNSRSPPGDFLIIPPLKQRSITDYMKIKKIPPRMKKIR